MSAYRDDDDTSYWVPASHISLFDDNFTRVVMHPNKEILEILSKDESLNIKINLAGNLNIPIERIKAKIRRGGSLFIYLLPGGSYDQQGILPQ